MAHEIFGSRFIHRNEPAWHRIAKRVIGPDEQITAREAMAEVAGDIEVVKHPLTYTFDGVQHDSGHVAIVRKPTAEDKEPHVLGVTSDAWVAATYPELAGALDELAKTHKVETAGTLKKGGIAFLCFRAPDWDVKGDQMRSYFAASFSLIPGVGHRVMHSPVRVVCWNTLTMAEGQATINLPVQHSTDSVQKIALAGNLVSKFRESQQKAKEVFDAFAEHFITAADAEAIFAAAFPNPTVPAKLRLVRGLGDDLTVESFKSALTPDMLLSLEMAQNQYDRGMASAAKLRDAAAERIEMFEPAPMRGTAWAAYNACTEVSDWREGRGADESLLYGSRAREKSRAFAATSEVVGIK